jgi:hypothetical protein
MEFFETKIFAKIIMIVLMTAPLILWAYLGAVTETSSIKLRSVLSWIRLVRWVSWSFSIVLFLIALVVDHIQKFPYYAIGMSTFSAGLALPEGWLKRQIHPAG